ncbi:hypothetical protein CRENBAI_010396 [Crenichthys baileyi]|uniref:Uncharacterized protein n=1 Tax=Crenichthys baileyi TaxID=28760 RepID=A0AAV9QX86_9TELE
MPIPTQGQPPTSTQEENLHPPQHSNNSQNTLDTQVDSAPPPPTDPPPHQQSALLEGESTCYEMVPTSQFRRPLCPPMHRRPPDRCRMPEHAPALNSRDIPARTQASPAQPVPYPGGNTPQEPRYPKPTPARPPGQLPKRITCSHQMPPLRATKAPPRLGPQPLAPNPQATPA